MSITTREVTHPSNPDSKPGNGHTLAMITLTDVRDYVSLNLSMLFFVFITFRYCDYIIATRLYPVSVHKVGRIPTSIAGLP